jgi:phosphotriesterase-related protein
MVKNLIAIVSLGIVFSACASSHGNGELITVRGRIPVGEMGTSLIHEHVLVDFIGADSTGYHRWSRPEVVKRALPFLMEAKQRGVKTFIDCTPAYLGRDPVLLRELSEKTGMNILTNTGYYGARNNQFIPGSALNASAEDIARVWIKEYEHGIEGTGIYPGFIKISVDRDSVLSSMHAKLVKAAAIAHKATGLTIVSHTGTDAPAFAQLKILLDEGVSADAFVWTHAQQGTLDGYRKAAKMGAWISLDNVNQNNPGKPGGIDWMVGVLTKLKEEGLLHKVLISHDAGWYNVGQENGGLFRGYCDIFDHLVPALKSSGFSSDDIERVLSMNPQTAYAIKIRKP